MPLKLVSTCEKSLPEMFIDAKSVPPPETAREGRRASRVREREIEKAAAIVVEEGVNEEEKAKLGCLEGNLMKESGFTTETRRMAMAINIFSISSWRSMEH